MPCSSPTCAGCSAWWLLPTSAWRCSAAERSAPAAALPAAALPAAEKAAAGPAAAAAQQLTQVDGAGVAARWRHGGLTAAAGIAAVAAAPAAAPGARHADGRAGLADLARDAARTVATRAAGLA